MHLPRSPRAAPVTAAFLLLLVACRQAPPEMALGDAGRLLGIVATCAEVEGDVQVRRAGEAYWEPAELGTTLRGGDWVRTSAGSRCRIALIQGASVRIDEQTVAEVGQLGDPGYSRALVALETGTLEAMPAEAGQGSAPLIFRTPDGRLVEVEAHNVGAEPAIVDVSVSGGAMHVVARRGTALVSVGGALPQETPQGSAAELTVDGPVITPLPPFPESREPPVDASLPCEPGGEIGLQWTPVEAAGAYRVQVARDLSFRKLVLNKVVAEPRYALAVPDSADTLAWRIASLDAKGRASDFGFARRIFCLRSDFEDRLRAPPDDAVFVADRQGAAVRLDWSPTGPGAVYRVIVARAPDLSRDLRLNQQTAVPHLEVALEPGTYYWGAYQEKERSEPLFVVPRRIRVVAGTSKLKLPEAIREWRE